ncbi:MAG: holin family protein [Steroidobacteraceae bacterium]|nr:holin family protein [Steroidobacteraceae bacterium]
MALEPITAALEVGGKLIDKFWPDANEAQRQRMQQFLAVFTAQAGIVQTEAASQHWLAANWRPLMMLTFCGLIVTRWFGWAAPNLSEAEYLKLWDIVELGLGGYVIGRTAEKIVPEVAKALKR